MTRILTLLVALVLGLASGFATPARADSAARLDQGLSRHYRDYLLRGMRATYREKYRRRPPPLRVDLDSLRTFRDFDDQVTAPLNGFAGAEDYYRRCSSRNYFPGILVPTLVVQAADDPFLYPQDLPAESELGPGVTLEVAAHGGHVGFVTGSIPGIARYWLDERIRAFFEDRLRRDRG